MKTNRIFKAAIALILILTFAAPSLPAMAKAPVLKKVEYDGNGKVDVDFASKVSYKKASVTVKDSTGKTYLAKILEKDRDDLDFKISGFQTGETYTFTISGVKVRGTTGYGSVTGTVKIPAEKVKKKKAIAAATDHAAKNLGAVNIKNKEAEKDTYRGVSIWDIEFKGKIGRKWYEFEYKIDRATGKILRYKKERD